MPNWCQGVLKIRGKKKDILNFINNDIERLGWPRDEKGEYTKYPLDISIDDFGYMFISKTDKEHNSFLYFKDSRRLFSENDIEWYWNSNESDDLEETYIKCLDVKQAWSLDTEYLSSLSKTYNIDFKIIGIECGMGFSQEIEIIKGEVTTDKVNEYKGYMDFEWEVYDPRLGG